jgi:hypothetical protein
VVLPPFRGVIRSFEKMPNIFGNFFKNFFKHTKCARPQKNADRRIGIIKSI